MSRSEPVPFLESGNPYTIEWARFETGERLPLLVLRATGLPIEAPTYWIAASERPLNKAAATLAKQLRHLMLLYLWADARGRTPEELIRSPGFLTLTQLNDLDRFCRQRLPDAITVVLRAQAPGIVLPIRKRKARNLEKPDVMTDVGNRLAAIHAFLDHVSFDHVSRMEPGSDERKVYEESRKVILSALRERSCAFLPGRGVREPREGLAAEKRQLLLAVIRPDHADNPWDLLVRKRNELIVILLYEFGMRRGEVLCLRVGDVKLTPDGGLLTIVRRPLDPEDPRQTKPQVKTLGRELAIGSTLRELFIGYLAERRKLPGARRHPFLLVSSVDGAPLTYWSMTKIFKVLREKVHGLPDDLSAHVLRHDWNDRFSEMSDRASSHRTNVDATKEERMRAYIQGWSSNSETAATYTKRWTREAANKRSLAMQERREILIERTDEQPVSSDQRMDTDEEG
jgi:integrase